MRRHIIGASILMLFMLVGCIAPKPISRSSTMSFNTVLDVEMWASGDCVKVGDTVHLRATVKNRGTQSQVIDLKDKPVLDIVFGNPDTGHRWSEGRSLTPDLTRLELKPGESKSIEMDWVVDKNQYGPNHITALFHYDEKSPALGPGFTVNVGTCPGTLP